MLSHMCSPAWALTCGPGREGVTKAGDQPKKKNRVIMVPAHAAPPRPLLFAELMGEGAFSPLASTPLTVGFESAVAILSICFFRAELNNGRFSLVGPHSSHGFRNCHPPPFPARNMCRFPYGPMVFNARPAARFLIWVMILGLLL